MSEVLYIVDVFSLLFQVFHAIRQPMTSPAGLPTNAVYGFTGDLIRILKEKRPTHFVCAMDSPGPGTRVEIYADYKANRSEMPQDLQPQVPMIQRVMEAFDVPVIEHAGWEADDVIATLTRQAVEKEMQVRIVSADKDLRQLLGPQVQIFNIRKDAYLDETHLKEEWGIRPDQVIDFQSLVGDSVDNIPGVPSVGPKRATALLEKYGTLDEVLAHADEAPGKKLSENLKEYADQARMCRRLVELNTQLPLEVDWSLLQVHRPDVRKLEPLFKEYGFRRFIDEVKGLAGESAGPSSVPTARVRRQTSLFGDEEEAAAPPAASPARPDRTAEIVDSDEKFDRFFNELKQQRTFCVDLETTGLDAVRADIVGWAFSWEKGAGYYLPVQGPPGEPTLDPRMVVERLRPIVEDQAVEICNQNIKYDMLVLRRAGVRLAGVGMDPMIGDYLLDAGARSHGLDALADRYLGHTMIPISDLIGSGKEQKRMCDVEIAKVAEYAVEDAEIVCRLVDEITPRLKQEHLWDLYWDLERPLIPVLVDMEFTGIRVDVAELGRQSSELSARLEQLVQEIYTIAGKTFNIDSPLQLRSVLFDELQLPVLKRTKTGPSTDQSVLERLALLHPLPAKITEQRHLAKLKGTYLDALPAMVNPETGRIHASFNQVVAATGRLSSSDPNLQNIPIRTEEGRRIRKAFIPGDEGWKLVCADYSQIELRMLAHFSRDPVLIEAFEQGRDIHTAVAAEIFGVDVAAVDASMRRVAKGVNFGVIYGQSPFGLATALGIEQIAAAEFIDNYFSRHSGVARFLNQILDECAASGYAKTLLGRRRQIEGIRPERPSQLNLPERTAINTVIQGSAADLIKRAMINVHDRLAREQHPGRMLLQIHDELVFETPEDETASLVELVREEMEHALEVSVPLTVDIAIADNWLDAK